MGKFTKYNIESGMRIKLRSGELFIIIKNSKSFIGVNNSGIVNMDYRDKYTFKYTESNNPELDIIEVYDVPTWNSDYLKLKSFGKLLWKEPEQIKEVTLSELSKLFGCEVKIVKE